MPSVSTLDLGSCRRAQQGAAGRRSRAIANGAARGTVKLCRTFFLELVEVLSILRRMWGGHTARREKKGKNHSSHPGDQIGSDRGRRPHHHPSYLRAPHRLGQSTRIKPALTTPISTRTSVGCMQQAVICRGAISLSLSPSCASLLPPGSIVRSRIAVTAAVEPRSASTHHGVSAGGSDRQAERVAPVARCMRGARCTSAVHGVYSSLVAGHP